MDSSTNKTAPIAEAADDKESFDTKDFLNLENLIKSYLDKIDQIKQELKKQKALYNDSFESDAVYQEHEKAAKESAKVKSETKQEILKQPSMQALKEKILDLRIELKELQETLSDYLIQYQKQTGLSEIEGEDGETMLIVNTAKLVKGSRSR